MLVLSPTRPLGLGKPNNNRRTKADLLRPINGSRRCAQLVLRATEPGRLESLMAATTMALLVQMSSGPQLGGWGPAVRPAYAAQVITSTTGTTTDTAAPLTTSRRPPPTSASANLTTPITTTTDSDIPAPSVPASKPNTGGFFNLFNTNRQPTASPLDAATSIAVAPAADSAVRPLALGVSSTDGELELEGAEQLDGDGPGDLRSLARWGFERAALLTLGGLAGVALVRTLSSPATRAVSLDAVAAAAAAKAEKQPSPSSSSFTPATQPATARPPLSDAPGQPAAVLVAAQQWPQPYQEGAPYGSEYGGRQPAASGQQRWPGPPRPVTEPPPPQQAGAAGFRTWPQRPGPAMVPPQSPPQPGAGGGGQQWGGVAAGGPPAIQSAGGGEQDTFSYDYQAAMPPPPGAPFYGPQPPPWWRGPYADYERYGGRYDGAYGPPPPPPYRGYVWGEQGPDSEAARNTGEPRDPYYPYYYNGGPPPGYWPPPPDPRRRMPYPQNDMYDPAYAMYDGPPPPPPPAAARGFADMRGSISPDGRLGRNPWAAVESRKSLDQRAVPSLSDRRTAMHAAAASPSSAADAGPDSAPRKAAPSSRADELSQLKELDEELAHLQSQIQELQGAAVSSSSDVSAAPAAAAPAVGSSGSARQATPQGRNVWSVRRTALRDWRQQLQQEDNEQQQGQPDEGKQQPAVAAAPLVEGDMRDGEEVTTDKGLSREGVGAGGTGVRVSVSPSADMEYQRLMQMWREAHPDEPHPEEGEGTASGGAEIEGRRGQMVGSGGDRESAERPPAPGIEEDKAAGSGGGGGGVRQEQPAAPSILRPAVNGSMAATPAPPPAPPPPPPPPEEADVEEVQVVAASSDQGQGPDPSVGAGMSSTLEPQQTTTRIAVGGSEGGAGAGGDEGGGPMGWFSRMFRGLGGGGRGAAKQDDREAPAEPQKAQSVTVSEGEFRLEGLAESVVQQQQRQDGVAGSKMPAQQQQQQTPSWEALREMEQAAEAYAREQQHERREHHAAEAAIQQGEGSVTPTNNDPIAVAATAVAAVSPQVAHNPAVTATTGATATGSSSTDSQGTTAPPAPTSTPPASATTALPSTTAAPSSRPSANKDSIQQLKATSAAAADRAAETLARIRAMRAAAQGGSAATAVGGPAGQPSTNGADGGGGKAPLNSNGKPSAGGISGNNADGVVARGSVDPSG